MLSIFQPATCVSSTTSVPYTPPFTANYYTSWLINYTNAAWPATAKLTALNIPVCDPSAPDTVVNENAPLAIFSPSLGTPRLLYNELVAAVASYGYTVVSIDHPYDAEIVEYPDSDVVYGHLLEIETADTQQAALNIGVKNTLIRAADVSAVLDALSDPGFVAGMLPRRGAVPFCVEETLIFGHSLGGATAAQVMLHDARRVGGVNLDGSFRGGAASRDAGGPFMVVNHAGNAGDVSWEAFFREGGEGWRVQVEVAETVHNSFVDFAVDLETFGVDIAGNAALVVAVGSLKGRRMVDIVSKYVIAFFDGVTSGKVNGLFVEQSAGFPEVRLVGHVANGSATMP